MYELGEALTKAPAPSFINASANNLGLLPADETGVWTTAKDWFACNSYMIDNVCNTANPTSGTIAPNFKLATWYRFELAEASNVIISSPSRRYKRIFAGDITTNCNLPVYADDAIINNQMKRLILLYQRQRIMGQNIVKQK